MCEGPLSFMTGAPLDFLKGALIEDRRKRVKVSVHRVRNSPESFRLIAKVVY